jgi:hypothetical protein
VTSIRLHSVAAQACESGLVARRALRTAEQVNTNHSTQHRSAYEPSRVKSKSNGNSFPFGILAPSARSSSKNGCTIASTALNRTSGVYSRSFETRSIASGAVRGRKTCYDWSTFDPPFPPPSPSEKDNQTLENGWGLICGNLCSM